MLQVEYRAFFPGEEHLNEFLYLLSLNDPRQKHSVEKIRRLLSIPQEGFFTPQDKSSFYMAKHILPKFAAQKKQYFDPLLNGVPGEFTIGDYDSIIEDYKNDALAIHYYMIGMGLPYFTMTDPLNVDITSTYEDYFSLPLELLVNDIGMQQLQEGMSRVHGITDEITDLLSTNDSYGSLFKIYEEVQKETYQSPFSPFVALGAYHGRLLFDHIQPISSQITASRMYQYETV